MSRSKDKSPSVRVRSGGVEGLYSATGANGQVTFLLPAEGGNSSNYAGYMFRADYSGTQTYSDPILVTADVNNPVSIPVGGSAIFLPLEGAQATVSGLNRSVSQKTSFTSQLTRNPSFIPSSGWNPALVIARSPDSGQHQPGARHFAL